MQTGVATLKFENIDPRAARASMLGVLTIECPVHPNQSARCWSVIIIKIFGKISDEVAVDFFACFFIATIPFFNERMLPYLGVNKQAFDL
jgi:hypothetical protein